MDNSEITNILDSFTACYHSFKTNDLLDLCENPIDFKILESTIISDSRFIRLSFLESNDYHFISKKILISWFIDLIIRLCKIRQFVLSKRQLALTMSHLRIEGRWHIPPIEAIQLAQSLNFVFSKPTLNTFIFPLAKILSFVNPSFINSAHDLLCSIYQNDMSKQELETLCDNFFKDSFSKFKNSLSKSDKRTKKILTLRSGFGGIKKQTLREISKRLGITRERVRQIEQTWLKQQKESSLFTFICDLVAKGGNLVTRLDSPDAPFRRLLYKNIGIPYVELSNIGVLILGVLPKEAKFINRLFNDWKSNIATNDIDKILEEQEKIFLTEADIKIVSGNLVQAIRKQLNYSQKVYLALRSIGKPAHYSRVAEACHALFPETQFTEHNVHAVLCRGEYKIIWIGIRGVYALKEWGYNRPSKTLFDTVTEIVNKFYWQTRKPVPYEIIMAEMSKYRRLYNPYSVLCAAYRNPRLEEVDKNSFAPKHSSHLIQDKTSEEELHRILENFQSKLNVET